jgi:hypothetical protein
MTICNQLIIGTDDQDIIDSVLLILSLGSQTEHDIEVDDNIISFKTHQEFDVEDIEELMDDAYWWEFESDSESESESSFV